MENLDDLLKNPKFKMDKGPFFGNMVQMQFLNTNQLLAIIELQVEILLLLKEGKVDKGKVTEKVAFVMKQVQGKAQSEAAGYFADLATKYKSEENPGQP